MEIVVASGNRGKIREFTQILECPSFLVRPMSELGIPEPEETGSTFEENALLKARTASRHANLPTIADDSGLSVDCLDGAPGVYSARYAGLHATDHQNVKKLLNEMNGVDQSSRRARFHCVIAVVRHFEDEQPLIFSDSWQGEIATTPSGENGFGYDPVFYLPEYRCTAAQLKPEIKNRISHRAKALEQFKAKLHHTDILATSSGQNTRA
ncbi:MAG: XTP/dITP diphosphatase [Gammaproteobacteria bacterium]|nr:XTP/dITP diphosphatase [Gammaproteobacteria bacterium]